LRAIAARARYLVLVAVGGLTGLATITFGWATAKGLRFAHKLITADGDEDLLVVDLLVVIDTYLLAIVQVIVVVGLYELFIGDLDVPRWLEARSLTDLNRPSSISSSCSWPSKASNGSSPPPNHSTP
jgi:uncharacterized membrane protein YqhA